MLAAPLTPKIESSLPVEIARLCEMVAAISALTASVEDRGFARIFVNVHEGEIPTLVLAPLGSCLLASFEKSFREAKFTYEIAMATLTGFEPVLPP